MAVPILRSPRVEGERTLRQAVERDQSDRAALAKRRALFEAPRTGEGQRLQQPKRTKRCVLCVTDHKMIVENDPRGSGGSRNLRVHVVA